MSRFTLHALRLRATDTTSLGLALRAALGHRLAHEGELTLLRLEAEGEEVLDGLLASGVLLAGDDAAVMLHQIALLQAA